MGKIISVTSGKGGVGKTMTTINMAIAAAKSGARVLLVDGDLGMSNIDVVMGLEPNGTLKDVLDGTHSINDIVHQTKLGIDVISSGSGITKLANMSPLSRSFLVHELNQLPKTYDFIFIDTGAGIAESVMTLNSISDVMVVVTTPEPHAITDAYALIKIMAEDYDRLHCALLVNQTINSDEGRKVATKIAEVANRFCGCSIKFVGSVATDNQLSRLILGRKVGADASFTLCGQGWSQAWYSILQILNSHEFVQKSSGLDTVWQAMSSISQERQNLDP